MSETITYRGTTIWSDATSGVSWRVRPRGGGREVLEVAAPLGEGYWLKQGNTLVEEIDVDLVWIVADKGALRAAILALSTGVVGSLVVPDWGTFANCRLMPPPQFESFKTSGSNYIVQATLQFRAYP